MGGYSKIAFRLFSRYTEFVSIFFPDLKLDLKKARIRTSVQEFITTAMLTSFIIFLAEIPLLSYIFGTVFKSFLFSFITAFTTSVLLSVLIFILFTKYPKTIISSRSKKIDNALPFAALYLSSVAGTKLPLHKVLKIFAKFSKYEELSEEVNLINKDIDVFGFDLHTALERAVERAPSKNFKEFLWGMLSTSASGGDVVVYLREKSDRLMQDYRRKIAEFAKKLMLLSEIYLSVIILGAIFFVILTSIFSGMTSSVGGSIIILQAIIIFIFVPLTSLAFILLIKTSTPGGD